MLYADLTNVKGDYITDVVRVGNAAVKNQTLGLARYSDGITNGIMGIGFASDEASAQASNESTKCIYYHMCPKGTNYMTPTFVDQLAEQGAIGSKTCSLWLNDLGAFKKNSFFLKKNAEMDFLPARDPRHFGILQRLDFNMGLRAIFGVFTQKGAVCCY